MEQNRIVPINNLTVGSYSIENFEELKETILNAKTSLLNQLKALSINEKGEVDLTENIKDVKEFKARFNGLAKSINDERIRQEKLYMEHFNVGKQQCAELISIAKSAVSEVEGTITAYENKIKAEKQQAINTLWEKMDFKTVPLERLQDEKWLNKTYSIKKIEDEMIAKIDTINSNISMLEAVIEDKYELGVAKQEYLKTFDIANVINSYKERMKIKDTMAVKKQVENIEKNKKVVSRFEVKATVEQMEALSRFLKYHDYDYKNID